jgi:multidrug efflux pump subunit AcrB
MSTPSWLHALLSFPLQRQTFAFLAFGGLFVAGLLGLKTIPKTEDPVIPIPIYPITVVLPGASPEDIERLVVDPLERALKSIDNIKLLKATAQQDVAVVVPEFFAGVDPDKTENDVRRALDAANLPVGVVRKSVERAQSNNVKTLVVGLTSDTADWTTIEHHAKDLRRQLERIAGVKDVSMQGLATSELRVQVDAARAAAIGITSMDVVSAIEQATKDIPSGAVTAGSRTMSVRGASVDTADDVRNTVVRSLGAGQALVRVSDVATVWMVRNAQGVVTRLNGERAVFVSTTVQKGRDVLAVQTQIEAVVSEHTALAASDGVRVVSTFNQARNIKDRLQGFLRDFLIAIVLVLITLLPLGPRASIVVMVSVPLSLATGVIVLQAFGFTINQLSIVGFIIALGLLVDDSIVVVENIARTISGGANVRQAALQATMQIAPSVLGCTATLLFAFLPLMSLPGGAGDFIRSLPVAVVATVAASLVVSMLLVPLLSAVLLKPEAHHDGNTVLRVLKRMVEATFRPLLRAALLRPWTTLFIGALAVAGSFALVPRIGFSLFPKADIPQVIVRIQMPSGSSLSHTQEMATTVEGIIREVASNEVEHLITSIGNGAPTSYYNIRPLELRASSAEMLVVLRRFDPNHTPGVLDQLRARFDALADGRVTLLEMQQGPPVDAPIAMRVSGQNMQDLEVASSLVANVMRQVDGTRDVNDPAAERLPHLKLSMSRERLAAAHVPVVVAEQAVRIAVAGQAAGTLFQSGDDDPIPIVITQRRSTDGLDLTPADVFEEVWLPTPSGPLPLSAVSSLSLDAGPDRIRHVNDQRSMTITSEVTTGSNTNRVTAAVLEALKAVQLPSSVTLTAAGEIESRQESFGGIGIAIIVALFGVLSVLVLEFGSLRGTVVVAAVIPFGIAGGLVALFLSGYTLSFTAMVGFVALVGIEVKNSILLVDFTDELRSQGVPLDQAIIRAGEVRFIPILLTTATALGGLVPLAVEQSSLFSPLAIVIIGGLLSSTFVARLITPVAYKLLSPPVDTERTDEASVVTHDTGAPVQVHKGGA